VDPFTSVEESVPLWQTIPLQTTSRHSQASPHRVRRIAWRLQARAEGDLSERARERAVQLAEDVDLRLRAPGRFWKQLGNGKDSSVARDPRIPAVGTVLKREHQGKTIAVTVLDEGFDHNGRTYGSLSAIAHHATGTRWNGFTFFQL
jgi:hypothetical protein